jgi:hypothetical protein
MMVGTVEVFACVVAVKRYEIGHRLTLLRDPFTDMRDDFGVVILKMEIRKILRNDGGRRGHVDVNESEPVILRKAEHSVDVFIELLHIGMDRCVEQAAVLAQNYALIGVPARQAEVIGVERDKEVPCGEMILKEGIDVLGQIAPYGIADDR